MVRANFVMDVMLPDDRNGIKSIMPLINDNSFKGWISQMSERKTDLTFPDLNMGIKRILRIF